MTTFRLFDLNPTAQCVLQVLRQIGRPAHGALLENADRRDVGECLRKRNIVRAERTHAVVEDVHRADPLITQPHRQCVNHAIAGRPGAWTKVWPANIRLTKVDVQDLFAGLQ